jgi:hypothetical protein
MLIVRPEVAAGAVWELLGDGDGVGGDEVVTTTGNDGVAAGDDGSVLADGVGVECGGRVATGVAGAVGTTGVEGLGAGTSGTDDDVFGWASFGAGIDEISLWSFCCQERGSESVYAAATPPDNPSNTTAMEPPAATRAADRRGGWAAAAAWKASTARAWSISSASVAGAVSALKTGSSRNGARSSPRRRITPPPIGPADLETGLAARDGH